MGAKLEVNTDDLVKLTLGLEKLSDSAFPTAVRRTLNSAAFEVKKKTLPATARRTFTQRQANFFKANSSVDMARGFQVDGMRSMVGMVDLGGSNYAVDNLVQQERGGMIGGKSFIPLDPARTAKSYKRKVKTKERISKLDKLVQARKTNGANKKQRFIKAVNQAGIGGVVMDENGIIWRVNNIRRVRGKAVWRLTPIYSYEARRKVQVKPTHFMERASDKVAKQLPQMYIKEAKKLFDKALGL